MYFNDIDFNQGSQEPSQHFKKVLFDSCNDIFWPKNQGCSDNTLRLVNLIYVCIVIVYIVKSKFYEGQLLLSIKCPYLATKK